jgi:hypothetical protein
MRKRRGKLSNTLGEFSRFAQNRFQPGTGEGSFLLRQKKRKKPRAWIGRFLSVFSVASR